MDECECGWSRRKVKKTVAFMTWNQSIVWFVFICTDSPADENHLMTMWESSYLEGSCHTVPSNDCTHERL